jgi:N-acylneuraminate cytidylyltransferase/CMP-N,N'-diacetyllegionaminic acid synthase
MYKNKKILCVIPARSGSKGLPGKNIKRLLGKPLIAYSIEQAKKSRYIDKIIVSTDSRKISKIAQLYGAEIPFIRPKRLATDKAGTIDVLLHAIDWMENRERYDFDILVLLHANTPLRDTKDIDKSIELLFLKKADNIFSVAEAHRNPYFNMVEIGSNNKPRTIKKGNFTARQLAPKVYDMNSSIYVWRKDALKKKKGIFLQKTRVYVMPKNRSVDIDDHLDFKICEVLMRERIKI